MDAERGFAKVVVGFESKSVARRVEFGVVRESLTHPIKNPLISRRGET